MDILIIIVLIIAAIVLFLVELFVISRNQYCRHIGFGLCGLCQLPRLYLFGTNSRIHYTVRFHTGLHRLIDLVYAI